MSKRTQKLQLSLTAKRNRSKEPAEVKNAHLWPAGEGDSFLDCAMQNHSNFQDDSLFHKIDLPKCTEDKTVLEAPLAQFLETEQQSLFLNSISSVDSANDILDTADNKLELTSCNDTFFNDICLNDFNCKKDKTYENINDSLFFDVKEADDEKEEEEEEATNEKVQKTQICLNKQFRDDDLNCKKESENLFCDLKKTEDEEEAKNEKVQKTQIFVHQQIRDDDFFNDISLNVFKKESENLKEAEDHIQCTQRFLTDVHDVVNQIAVKEEDSVVKNTQTSYMRMSQLETIFLGSQYAVHDEYKENSFVSVKEAIADFSKIDWAESQSFHNITAHPAEYDFPSKGDFYGLPMRVKQLIFEHKGIKELYEWQDECLQLPAIKQHKNLIYALPTSGGKTLVSEILILRELICREKNVLFILPYVSIVQEKVSALSPFAMTLNFLVEEYTAGRGSCPPVLRKRRKSVYIASIEKASILLDSLIDAQRANELGLVVVDELHLIGERGRGATLEALLTKVNFINAGIQIVGMSATIGNLTEISQFLKADVYTRGFRPVELREYIKCGSDILEINTAGKTIEDTFIFNRKVDFKYSDAVAKADPDHIAGLVYECAPEHSCLIFCSTRKNCENVALLLTKILPKSKFLEHRQTEKQDLLDALNIVCGVVGTVLARTIPFGIAYHHSGLTSDERKFIETAYRFGVISVICCTSTLAAGVNLPAKRVIIRAPYVGKEFLTLSRYKQMVGRAGRAGLGETGESILVANSRDNIRVGEMIFSPMDKALSSLDYQENIGLQNLVLSCIGLDLASCRNDLLSLVRGTLLAVQADMTGINIEELVLDILRGMFKNKVLKLSTSGSETDALDMHTTQAHPHEETMPVVQKRIFVRRSTRFELSTIGKAALKAGIDYKRAQAIHSELKSAQEHMILSNYAHLLYLVVCFNTQKLEDVMFDADAMLLFELYNSADNCTLALFKRLGFTEAYAMKIAKTKSIEGALELRLHRIFKTLVLVDILNLLPLPEVAKKFNIERGTLQSLISQTVSAASSMSRFCEQISEFWCFQPLFQRICIKMDRCCTAELEPLLDLPGVKINRAKQLFTAGYKTIEDIAKANPRDLITAVEHLPFRSAKEIVAASRIMVMKRLDDLEEATETLKMCMKAEL